MYNKWQYQTDNEFAIDLLRRLPARHQSLHNSIRCCTGCKELLCRGQPRTISEPGCDLCKRLCRLGGTRIKRNGSDLVLDGRRVSILRSEPGEWVYSALLARLTSVAIESPNVISLRQSS